MSEVIVMSLSQWSRHLQHWYKRIKSCSIWCWTEAGPCRRIVHYVVRDTPCSDVVGVPWLQSTHRAHRLLLHYVWKLVIVRRVYLVICDNAKDLWMTLLISSRFKHDGSGWDGWLHFSHVQNAIIIININARIIVTLSQKSCRGTLQNLNLIVTFCINMAHHITDVGHRRML